MSTQRDGKHKSGRPGPDTSTRKPTGREHARIQGDGHTSPKRPLHPIYVNTNLYRVVHGQEPSGRRTWGFAMGHGSGIVWVADSTFDAARAHALKKAQELAVTTISVLP